MAGQTLSRTAHFALHSCALEALVPDASSAPLGTLFPETTVWLGAMVPKRWAKRAVTRNCIKRQIYGLSLEFEAELPRRAHVVRLRAGFDRETFVSAASAALKETVRAELLQLFGRAV
jgi:ribonuclease P protein component